MKTALLGFSVAVLALTGCSKFEAKQSDAVKGDLNEALQGTWVETSCTDGNRKLLDFSKDTAGNSIVTVAVLRFAENDKECLNVESGTLLAKNTHNLQVSKYKTDYAAGKVKTGDDKDAQEAVVKRERLHLGKTVYTRVDRSKFAAFLDNGQAPVEQPEALKDPSTIVIEELEGEAIVELEEIVVEGKRSDMEEIVVEAKKMTLEEQNQYDLEQTVQNMKMPTFEFETEENLAAKNN